MRAPLRIVAAMVRAARPARSVAETEAPDWMFLEDRPLHPATMELLEKRRWSFVVLQAQKYSSSGLFDYPIDGAVQLAQKARLAGAVPILFPEWPRRGIPETQRIYDLHVSIARREPACVAPIPQAWDLAAARHPTLVLHDMDGNHSAPAGAFLAALVIATTMTGTAPDTLPALPIAGVDAATQVLLRAVAAETVLAYAPRQWCPTRRRRNGRSRRSAAFGAKSRDGQLPERHGARARRCRSPAPRPPRSRRGRQGPALPVRHRRDLGGPASGE